MAVPFFRTLLELLMGFLDASPDEVMDDARHNEEREMTIAAKKKQSQSSGF